MHEPLVEALPGLLGAASAVGGLGGIFGLARANLRKKRQAQREADQSLEEEPSRESR